MGAFQIYAINPSPSERVRERIQKNVNLKCPLKILSISFKTP
jgi:hypothetical protein